MDTNDIVARLRAVQAALGDGRDCRSENERSAYIEQYNRWA